MKLFRKRKEELVFVRGFDKTAFMEYIDYLFEPVEGYGRAVIYNIIAYANKHEHIAKDGFAIFISDMLPEISFGEVAAFCEDCCLTRDGIREKEKFWMAHSGNDMRYLCSQCVQAIESREGPQFKHPFYQEDDDDDLVICEWCGEAPAEYVVTEPHYELDE